MKTNPLISPRTTVLLGLATGVCAGSLHAQTTPNKDIDVVPTVTKSDQSLATRQYLTGDWDGQRTALENEGVTFGFNNIGDLQSDVTGSQEHHVTYFGRFRFTTDINFNKLSGFDGEFFFSPIWQYGQNLSAQYLHTNTLTSSIAGPNSIRLDQMWYQQGFFNSMLKVKLGQVAPVNEFGATDFFDILFNDELGYAPNAIFNTKQPFSPAGKPGIIITGDLSDLTPGLYVKTGVYTAYNNPYHPDAHGVAYDNDFDHGMAGSFEVGYNEQHTQYAGVYKLGVNATPDVNYINPATGQHYRGDYNIYGTVEKTVYHPEIATSSTDPKDMKAMSGETLDMNRGLDLLFEAVGEPGDRNPLDYEFTFGARYTGLFDWRPTDKIGFGLIYSNNGDAYSDAYNEATGGDRLGGETTVELDYQYNPTPWLSLQPDAQYIFNPGGDARRDDILMLGFRTIVRF